MNLNDLAKKYLAYEQIDKTQFQRRARILQSIWREQNGYLCGFHNSRGTPRLLGSRLEMPWAKETLGNFLTEGIKEVVRAEVLDKSRSKGKLYGRPRIFNDLLSSQPLCFNLFGELQRSKELASTLVSQLTNGRFIEVMAVEFEYSPSRSDGRYTNDRSAFDVYLECKTASGGRGFIGIEVKYHENLNDPVANTRVEYDKVANMMGCFHPLSLESLKKKPLQQVWRDHLLSGAIRLVDGYEDALFVVLFPKDNDACQTVVNAYRSTLVDSSSFDSWYIEDVLNVLSRHTSEEWPRLVYDRYCRFDKVDAAMR